MNSAAPDAAKASDENLPDRIRHAVRPMLPGIIGLSCAQVTTLAINQTDQLLSDGDMLTNGASIVKCLAFVALLGIALAYDRLESGRGRDTSRYAGKVVRAAICLACVVLLLLNLSNALHFDSRFESALRTIGSITGSGIMFYWVVAARNVGPSKAIAFVASARMLSQIPNMVITMFPEANLVLGLAGIAGQIACLRWLKRSPLPSSAERFSFTNEPPEGQTPRFRRFFGGFEGQIKDRKFLTSCIVAFALVSVAAGLLRGFPDGQSIPVSVPTLVAMSLSIMAFYALGIVFSFRTSPFKFLAAGWSFVQVIGIGTVLAYALLPDTPELGAAMARVFNDLLHAFRMYFSIALIGLGWRNPYYYVIVVYLIFLFPRAIARTGLAVASDAFSIDPIMVLSVTSLIFVLTGQLLFQVFLRLLVKTTESRPEQRDSLVEKVLGIDHAASLSDIRTKTMEQHVEELGRRYGLSAREMEVLVLFASGYTQKRVAEELYVTLNTAHAHIRHIYSKTGCHSRQEILSLIEKLDGEERSDRTG